MKRIFISLIILLVIIAALAGCSSNATPGTTTAATSPVSTSSAAVSTAASTTSAAATASTTSAKPTSTTTAPAASTAVPQRGGILRIMPPPSFRPPGPIGWPAEINVLAWSNTVPCLQTLISLDLEGKPLPLLATEWSVADNLSSITLKLRQGVKFHDGSSFNSNVAKFNLDAVMAAKLSGTELWKSIDVIDEYTIRINLNAWKNSIYDVLASLVGTMVSQEAYQKNGVEWMRWNPVGTGPFKFQSFQRDVELKYIKNDNYWEAGKPYLEGVTFLYNADENTGAMSFRTGGADMMNIQSTKVLSELKAEGYITQYPIDGANAYYPDSKNANSPWFDIRVRQAAEYAINKEAIVKALDYGYGDASYQAVLPGNLGYVQGLEPRKYNPTKAKALLAEAGYPDGFDTSIYVGTDQPRDMMATIQNYLKDVGIRAELVVMEIPKKQQLWKGWNNGLLHIPINSWTNFARYLEFRVLSGNRLESMLHPEGFEKAITDALSSKTLDAKLLQKCVKYMYDYSLAIPIDSYCIGMVSTKNVHDTGFFEYGFQIWTPQNAWLSK